MRRGEALALAWDDLDLDDGQLRVRATLSRVGRRLVITDPKADKSRRVVPIPRFVVAELRAHRVRQIEARLHAGSAWQAHGLVFPSRPGTPARAPQRPARDDRCRREGRAARCRAAHAAALGGLGAQNGQSCTWRIIRQIL
jgi:integrase